MIADKVIIITGASSGIGKATAKLLAGKGAKVVHGARRTDNLKRIADEIKQHGGQAVYQELDVTNGRTRHGQRCPPGASGTRRPKPEAACGISAERQMSGASP